MEQSNVDEPAGPILHVIVVGFHHKKGCQVEYSYPPLVPDSPDECPTGWKYLPTLALPDGSHNYDEDTVYFHLPSLTHPQKTVYGVSCFRQIPVEKLKNRTSDITRGTVQKSVCVLSSQPLYGHIQVKMSLITHAYFEEGDFSQVSLLKDTYSHLNTCMRGDSQLPPQVFVGLSARDFILQFRHKALLLFKLLLLERKVVFYQSPVKPLCAAILTLLSLHPGMIESGLTKAACVRPSRPMSPIPMFDHDDYDDDDDDDDVDDDFEDLTDLASKEKRDTSDEKDGMTEEIDENMKGVDDDFTVIGSDDDSLVNDNKALETMEGKTLDTINEQVVQNNRHEFNEQGDCNDSKVELSYPEQTPPINDTKDLDIEVLSLDSSSDRESLKNQEVHRVQSTNNMNLGENGVLPRDTSSDALAEARLTSNITQIAHVNPELCGLPLNIFGKGYLCLPYLSLPYLDLLGDSSVRGYVVGATNILFKQKKQLIDVLIEVESARIEATDPELRRQLHLTTEDLRFADYVVKHVAEPRKDVFLDGVGWEGGDEWIRTQFRVYLLSLLRTSLQQDSRQTDHFNGAFMAAWKNTNNYRRWEACANKNEINAVEPGHPFAGQLSVQDMKIRLTHTMQNTESGRKINQAMATTGRAVATTGKAVGGAISQARGAFSSWWSTLTTVQPLDGDVRQEITTTNPVFSGLSDESFDGQRIELKNNDNDEKIDNNEMSKIVEKNINKTPEGVVTKTTTAAGLD